MTGGGWHDLVAIAEQMHRERAEDATRPLVSCPNDGVRLSTGPDGQLFCPFDGWRPE
jgi:hypothetical protein